MSVGIDRARGVVYSGETLMRLYFNDIIKQTWQTLWAHKLRSFLTMFGIMWGVASLLLLGAVGEGFKDGQRKQLARIGQDLIFVWGGRIQSGPGSLSGGRPMILTYDDYLAIQGDCRLVRDVTPGYSYLCSNDPRVHFGLGTATKVDEIIVQWPGGNIETFPAANADQILTLNKGHGKTIH